MIRKYDQDDWITLVIKVEIVLGEDCVMISKYDQDDRCQWKDLGADIDHCGDGQSKVQTRCTAGGKGSRLMEMK